MSAYRTSDQVFFGMAVLLFAISAAITIVWGTSMSAMGGMRMPGGWTMSMAWMRMPGQTWMGAGFTFMGMWIAMMVAMMMPSLFPMLLRYRRAIGRTTNVRLGWLTTLVGTGYFFVWTGFGLAAYVAGIALAEITMQQTSLARIVPIALGVVVVLAGLLQFSSWKAHHLSCCRAMPGPGHSLSSDTPAAWRYGLRLGLHCSRCCAGLMAILLVIGVMDLLTMALVALVITVERMAGLRIARASGAVIIGFGLFVLFSAIGLM